MFNPGDKVELSPYAKRVYRKVLGPMAYLVFLVLNSSMEHGHPEAVHTLVLIDGSTTFPGLYYTSELKGAS
jgi:hypothetical protein